jgi:hypothetical protein
VIKIFVLGLLIAGSALAGEKKAAELKERVPARAGSVYSCTEFDQYSKAQALEAADECGGVIATSTRGQIYAVCNEKGGGNDGNGGMGGGGAAGPGR